MRLLNITQVRTYEKDTEVVAQGDDGDELFIVLTGKVQVEAAGAKIAALGPGQHFGEMALIDKAARSADVKALEPSSLLAIRRKDFFDIIRKDHGIAVKLLWSFLGVLNERLRNTSRELGEARESRTPELADSILSAFDDQD